MNEDFLFQPDQIAPDGGQVSIRDLAVDPYPDHRRVGVGFRISGYQQSLAASILLENQDGEQLAEANIVNIFNPSIAVTLHIPPGKSTPGEYRLVISLLTLEEIASDLDPEKVGDIKTNLLAEETISFTLL